MELRDHLIGPCATRVAEDEVDVDIGALVRRLVLFERYTLRSISLLEVRALVRAFGEGGLRELLADGCLKLLLDVLSMAQVGSPDALSFATLIPHDRRQFVSSRLAIVRGVPGLSDRQVRVLKRTIVTALVEAPDAPQLANRALDEDLDRRSPLIANGVALALEQKHGVVLDPAAIRIDVNRLDEATVRTSSNLRDLTGLPADASNDLVVRGILALGGLNIRVALMEQLEGIGGCEPGELSLFDGKLSMLLRDADPDAQEQRFQRVLSLSELPEPDLSRSPAVDVGRLLEARASPEARALRAWLRGVDRLDDAEIRESFDVLRAHLGRAFHATTGKVVRLAVNTAAGLLPGGAVVGAGLGALDTFLLERVLPEPGPYSFLSHTWPSLFSGS
jgi:hypothetical protein